MTTVEDSPEFIKFERLFRKLKDWCDDDPEALRELASTDEGIDKLRRELWATAQAILENQLSREAFKAPVETKFIAVWREFGERFEPVLTDLFGRFSIPDWKNEDSIAELAADLVDEIIEFACIQLETGQIELDATTAALYWERLKVETGFDLRGVFRRRALVPFVYFPTHIAARSDQSAKLSVYQNLRQAHDAFVFGAPFAALVLMRSIMEIVLREHYGANGNDLSERISNSRKLLPRGVSEAALHRLRKIANAVVHLENEKNEMLREDDPIYLEKEILSLFRTLRVLIENAPKNC